MLEKLVVTHENVKIDVRSVKFRGKGKRHRRHRANWRVQSARNQNRDQFSVDHINTKKWKCREDNYNAHTITH